ncbi:MAG: hypothetical protein ABIH39_00860 [Candidatus Margulisiibacteriota bacterium]
MKTRMPVSLIVIIVLLLSAVAAMAEYDETIMPMGGGMTQSPGYQGGMMNSPMMGSQAGQEKKAVMEKKMADKKIMEKCDPAMMIGMKMGGASMVAVQDGIVVLIGNKLLKYDRDLNLKKEVQIKVDCIEMKK